MIPAEPGWLLGLILIPIFVIGAILTGKLRRKQWSAFVAPRLRPNLLQAGSTLPRWLSFAFLLVGTIFLIIALSRPQIPKGTESEKTRGRNVMIALDLSRSMLVKDLKPDRLTQAKTLCYELIDAMPDDRIGLIGFAGEPYLYAPLTPDHGAIHETISQLDINSIPVGGTNLSAALKLAIETLKKTGQKENALILISDGSETTGKLNRLIQETRSAGVYVYAIAMGTESGDFIPSEEYSDGRHKDSNGNPVISRLEPEGLKALATGTNGRFVIATSAASIPDMVRAGIADLEAFEMQGRERVVAVEYYQWYLLPGIMFLIASIIAGTRWRSAQRNLARPSPTVTTVATASLLVFCLLPSHLDAAEWTPEKALESARSGRHKEAQEAYESLAQQKGDSEDAFRYRLAQGNAAWQAGNPETARHAFSQALRSKDKAVRAAAHHGLGLVLFDSGWRELSTGKAFPDTGLPTPEEAADAAKNQQPSPLDRIADALLGKQPNNNQDPKKEEKTKADPLAPFEEMVRSQLQAWLSSQGGEDEPSDGYDRFDRLLTDWIDSIKHYDNAIHLHPEGFPHARHNREVAVKHLKRLREILEELNENAQQMQQMQGEGEGQGNQPQPEGEGQGDGEPNPDGEGRGREREGQQGNQGEQEDQNPGDGEQEDPNNNGENGDKEDQNAKGKQPKEGETPEDAARRILRDNADFEKSAPRSRGRVDYEQPEKDW